MFWGMQTTALSVLVLGGTSWLGGVVARVGLERGHRVTCLARGESGRAPDGVRFVQADRWTSGAYDAVAGQTWDSVLDVSWQPVLVRSALGAIGPQARHWVYVSSVSVYADDSVPGQDESAAVHEPWSGTGEVGPERSAESYGEAKVACEVASLEARGSDGVLVARAGLIAGYGDRSDRFGYWPGRIARVTAAAPRLLAPRLDQSVQVIDVADLAHWLVHTMEQRATGVFNAVGDTRTFADVISASALAASTEPEPVEADDEWLVAAGVEPWMGPGSLAMWLPRLGHEGFSERSNHAARSAGLRLRTLEETTRSALTWERRLGLDRERLAGLSPEREAELLDRLAGHG